jgi:hypothetical protein
VLRTGARADVAVDGEDLADGQRVGDPPSSTQLTEARDRLDAEQAERRHREDEALATYPAVAGETDEVRGIKCGAKPRCLVGQGTASGAESVSVDGGRGHEL